MGYATGEARELPLRPTFDRRIKLEFHGARITSDGGLLAYRELDDVLGLTEIAITELVDGVQSLQQAAQAFGTAKGDAADGDMHASVDPQPSS